MERESDTNCNWRARYSHNRIGMGSRGLENKKKSGDHPSYNIVEIGLNTEKSLGDLRLDATQTPEKNHLQMLA